MMCKISKQTEAMYVMLTKWAYKVVVFEKNIDGSQKFLNV